MGTLAYLACYKFINHQYVHVWLHDYCTEQMRQCNISLIHRNQIPGYVEIIRNAT